MRIFKVRQVTDVTMRKMPVVGSVFWPPFSASCLVALVVLAAPLLGQEPKPAGATGIQATRSEVRRGDSWTDALADRAQRGTLHDAFQFVRGDRGRWSDEPRLLHAPPIGEKPANVAIDDWFDQLLEKPVAQTTSGEDNWLLLRTRQMDDNDRLWVDRVERRGNQFTVVLHEAIWQGKYFKTFTYYDVFGVNLGKLEPGKYEAKWVIQPRSFKQFTGDGRPQYNSDGRQIDNWPKDDLPAEKKATELRVAFSVTTKTSSRDQRPNQADIDSLARVDRQWSAGGAGGTPSFTKHVVPLFNKVGCSNRSCHGSFQGQGGFQLSLFGYDPAADHQRLLADGGRGPRIDTKQVDQSLALRKPLG